MPAGRKDIALINARIEAGQAKVVTAAELGRTTSQDVDVVTLAYQTPISGSSAMLVVPVAERGVFTRAERIWLNGIQGFPGPAPNERLGLVDTLVFADQKSKDPEASFSGSDLLLELIEKKKIEVECLSVEGDTYQSEFTIEQVQFARMYVYDSPLPTSGSEAFFGTIRAGSRVLLNKAQGTVIGCGTRSSPERPSLSLTAEMFDMDSALLGGNGILCNSVALAVPVLDQAMLTSLFGWWRRQSSAGRGAGVGAKSAQIELAEHLTELIVAKEFLLTDSDMELEK
jgi:uncharacterized protein (DUF39 family)